MFQTNRRKIFTVVAGVFYLLMQTASIMAQYKNNPPILDKVTLRVADLEGQSKWYQSAFKFTLESLTKNKIILRKGRFILELNGQKDVIIAKKLVLPDQMRFLSSFSKFGFVINNLDDFFARIEKQKIETAGGVFLDDKLGFRTFIVKDPEGNLVQFFEPQGVLKDLSLKDSEWNPVFVMVITDDHQKTIDWYGEKLDFKEIGNRDSSSRNTFHRTLFNGKVLLELADLPGKVASKEKYSEIWKNAGGIISVGFSRTKNKATILDNNKNIIELLKQ